MKRIWYASLLSFGGYRRTQDRGAHLGITVKIDEPTTQEGRMVDIPLTPREAEQVIEALQYALQLYEREEAK